MVTVGALDTVNVSASWVTLAETPEWIAERTDELLGRLSARFGVVGWEMLLPTRKIGDPHDVAGRRIPWSGDLASLVQRSPVTAFFDTAAADEGYSFSLHGRTSYGGYVTVAVDAGAHFVGRRIPRHRLSLEIAPQEGDRVDQSVGGVSIEAIAESFDPQLVERIVTTINKLARRTGWQIRPSYLLWLRGDVLSDAVLPVGMSAERVGAGWLYSVPDEWSAERVIAVHEEFRAVNGIEVLPH